MTTTVIFGPPGTGKTRELATIAGRQTGPVLFLSYTKAAALEAAGRVGSHVECSTIHSLAFRILGLSRQSVVTPKKLAEFGEIAGIPFKGTDGVEEEQEGNEYAAVLSYARNRLISEKESYDRFGRPGNPLKFGMFVRSYEDWKQTFGFMDFDDMLTQASKVRFPDCPVVILDEAQDCTPLQWNVFAKVCAGAKDVIIAGDDDQAIYEWNGADPHGMVAAMERSGGTNRVLNKSWRVPRSVHALVHQKIIAEMKKRHDKVFQPMTREGIVTRWGDFEQVPDYVVFGQLPGIKITEKRDSTVLVLCRDNYRLRELQRSLHDRRVPYAMATSNSPYENRYARAIRGWQRDGKPLPEEQEAIAALIIGDGPQLVQAKDWKAIRARDWRTNLNIPAHMLDFYEAANLFAPLNVRLSTIHQAKGSEADVVVLDLAMTPRVEYGVDLDRDAELRVMYVGLTRAKHELHLIGENVLI